MTTSRIDIRLTIELGIERLRELITLLGLHPPTDELPLLGETDRLIEEAAFIDDAKWWKILWSFVPLSWPAIVTLATFMSLYAWTSFSRVSQRGERRGLRAHDRPTNAGRSDG